MVKVIGGVQYDRIGGSDEHGVVWYHTYFKYESDGFD